MIRCPLEHPFLGVSFYWYLLFLSEIQFSYTLYLTTIRIRQCNTNRLSKELIPTLTNCISRELSTWNKFIKFVDFTNNIYWYSTNQRNARRKFIRLCSISIQYESRFRGHYSIYCITIGNSHFIVTTKHYQCSWFIFLVGDIIFTYITPPASERGSINFFIKCSLSKETSVVKEPALAYEGVVGIEICAFSPEPGISSNIHYPILPRFLCADESLRLAATIHLV